MKKRLTKKHRIRNIHIARNQLLNDITKPNLISTQAKLINQNPLKRCVFHKYKQIKAPPPPTPAENVNYYSSNIEPMINETFPGYLMIHGSLSEYMYTFKFRLIEVDDVRFIVQNYHLNQRKTF